MKDRGPIDITTLNWEQPKTHETLPFDSQREITTEDWENITRCVRGNFQMPGENKDYFEGVIAIWILDPDMLPNVILPYKQSGIASIISATAHPSVHQGRFLKFSALAVVNQIVFPQKPTQLSERNRSLLKPYLDLYRDRMRETYIEIAANLKIAYPHLKDELGLDEDTFQGIAQTITPLGKTFTFIGRGISARLTAKARILYPKRFTEIAPSQEELQTIIKEERSLMTTEGWQDFVTLAAALKIIEAEEIIVNGHGLKLVKNKPQFTAPIPPMPPMRRF